MIHIKKMGIRCSDLSKKKKKTFAKFEVQASAYLWKESFPAVKVLKTKH